MKLRIVMTSAIALATTAALGFAAGPYMAQSIQPTVVQPSPAPAPSPAFSDSELRTFAAAVIGVQRITDTYLPMLKTATTIEDQERIENTASAEMNREVENHGMTVTRFTQILELTKVSPELADRVRWHIHESQAVGAYRTGATD